MEAASPARLYAALAGAFLLLIGIAGFFYSASFGAPGSVEEALGTFQVNAWANLLYVVTGALGILTAGFASRRYALAAGLLFTLLGVWGFALDGDAILGFLPAGSADDSLRLLIGLLGLLAAAATPKRARLEPRAQAAG